MRTLGVIPARGGSKGIPRKNIQPLGGKPLITYAVDSARGTKGIHKVVVSTDSAEIAAVAHGLGVTVIDRPAALAHDTARTEDALLHALDSLAARGERYDAVATLEPTAPLRSPALIDRCVERLSAGGCDAVLTVVADRSTWGRLRGERFEHLFPGQARRRQDREPIYRESSTVYVTNVDALRQTGSVLGRAPVAIEVTEEEAVDINTPLDLVIAEAILRRKSQGGTA